MNEKKYLNLEEFLSADVEKAGRDFQSRIWKKADGTPGALQYRIATVGDREAARQAAKGEHDQFDNAVYGCHLIALCLLVPKIPPMEVIRLRGKHAEEMDRLLDAILEKEKTSPL